MCPTMSYELTRPMPVFDIESYVGRSRAVDMAAIAWADVPRYPVSPEMIRTLRYVAGVESHTIIYLRSLLATRAVDDPDVATFLACWVYEETFHGLVPARFLEAAGAGRGGHARRAAGPRDGLEGMGRLLRGAHGVGRHQRADHAHRLPSLRGGRGASPAPPPGRPHAARRAQP